MSDTNFNSQCESGWTTYLDQPVFSENEFNRDGGILGEDHSQKGPCFGEEDQEEEEEEEEDLSMVSDASSGPSFYPEDCFHGGGRSSYPSSVTESAMESKDKKKKKTKKIKDRVKSQQHSYLDDTASSPAFISSTKQNKAFLARNEAVKEKGSNHSLSFSPATHKKGKSSSTKHFGFFGSPIEEKSAPEE